MKKAFVTFAAVCAVLVMVSSGFAAPKVTFIVANSSPEDTVTGLMTNKLKESLEKKSKGNIAVNVFHNSQLGGDVELTQSAQNGDITIVVQNTAPQVNFVPKVAVFDLPNLFTDVKVARKALDKFIPNLNKEYEKANLKILGIADQGFRVLSTNKIVNKKSDLKGLKIRTMENKNHMAYWKLLGANPTPLPFSELYLALQQGVVQGQENPYEVIVSNKFYEVQKYVINTNHILHTITITMSKKIYDSLTPEDKKLVEGVAKEVVVWGRQQADKRHLDRVGILKKNGVTIIDLKPEAVKEMRAAVEPVYKDIRKAVGDDLVNKLAAAINSSK